MENKKAVELNDLKIVKDYVDDKVAPRLAKEEAENTYLKKTDAEGTYLKKTDAEDYITYDEAASRFSGSSYAENTYLKKTAAEYGYLGKVAAEETYLKKNTLLLHWDKDNRGNDDAYGVPFIGLFVRPYGGSTDGPSVGNHKSNVVLPVTIGDIKDSFVEGNITISKWITNEETGHSSCTNVISKHFKAYITWDGLYTSNAFTKFTNGISYHEYPLLCSDYNSNGDTISIYIRYGGPEDGEYDDSAPVLLNMYVETPEFFDGSDPDGYNRMLFIDDFRLYKCAE